MSSDYPRPAPPPASHSKITIKNIY